jgi:hypothetical protein
MLRQAQHERLKWQARFMCCQPACLILFNYLLELKVDIVKWVGGLMLTQVAIIAALVKLL